MKRQSLIEVQAKILDGTLTTTSLAEDYLAKIEASKSLNIYVEVWAEELLAQAKELDQKARSNPDKLGRLFGLIISIKDVICYKGHKVTAGSKILENFESQFTATAIQKLLDEDALIIGRTNCDEFAMGSSNENSFYGPVRNGDDNNRVPGGSSGGAAVSVQVDTCHVAIGSDTGGSVRQPAGFCGVVGMKPTYGRISRYGLIAYASSFDQFGILAHRVEDVALVLEVMSGKDNFDATSSAIPVDKYSELETIAQNRFAYFDEVVNHPKLNSDIKTATNSLFVKIEAQGHKVERTTFELLDYLVPAYYVLTTAEASSNLARYDGIRYGFRSKEIESIEDLYHKSRTEAFGLEVKRRIILGAFVLSAGYYDAYYSKAQKVRNKITKALEVLFEKHDFIVMPTSPDVAWEIGAFDKDPVSIYLSDIFTVLANLCGIPAISIPLGTDANGNSFGIQLISAKFNEAQLLSAAYSIKNWS